MIRAEFDAIRFYAALDGARAARHLNWRQVADQSGVSAPTFSRLSQEKRPDVDSLAALLAWSDLSADDFFPRSNRQGSGDEPLVQIAMCLCDDPKLSKGAREALMQIIFAAYEHLREK